ncbi:hypothetical protein VTK56DRAFT_8909 [Thermocarpiscus australiensis]
MDQSSSFFCYLPGVGDGESLIGGEALHASAAGRRSGRPGSRPARAETRSITAVAAAALSLAAGCAAWTQDRNGIWTVNSKVYFRDLSVHKRAPR